MKQQGHDVHTWIVRGHECGGSLWDQQCVSLCRLRVGDCVGRDLPSFLGSYAARGMGSNLNHHGTPLRAWSRFPMIPARSDFLPNLVGTVRDRPVFDEAGPLLADPRVLLQTERGV
jgi:hypothetical protein